MNLRLKNVYLTIGEAMNYAHAYLDEMDDETRLDVMPHTQHCPPHYAAKYWIEIDHMVIFIYDE